MAPITFIVDAFYVFGGETDISHSHETTIGKLDANLIWSKVGDLNKGRNGHNVIYDGNYALVVGGDGGYNVTVPTEKCSVSSNGVVCKEKSPFLYRYQSYPELFLVPMNFCINQT